MCHACDIELHFLAHTRTAHAGAPAACDRAAEHDSDVRSAAAATASAVDTIGHALAALGLPQDGAALALEDPPATAAAARGSDEDAAAPQRAESGGKVTPPVRPRREDSGRFAQQPLDVRTAPCGELSTQSLEDCSLLEAASLRRRASSGALGAGVAAGGIGDSVATADTYASAELLSSVELDAHSRPLQAGATSP